jgi:hypothetical protein
MASMGHFLQSINWQQPWLAPIRPIAEPILKAQDWRQAVNSASAGKDLLNHRSMPIRFVAQEELPAGTAYEAYISATGCVPTRDNLHDFFNAMIWLSYPQIKAQLNAVQAAEIASALAVVGKPAIRGKVRDAATIFDENAALLITNDPALVEDLRNHCWQDLFLARRNSFSNTCEIRLFGHALLEKLVTPYKAITAHTWTVIQEAEFFLLNSEKKKAAIDLIVAAQLAKGLRSTDFTPLPVLGVPEWWENQDASFYSDASVFRPKRCPAPGNSTR